MKGSAAILYDRLRARRQGRKSVGVSSVDLLTQIYDGPGADGESPVIPESAERLSRVAEGGALGDPGSRPG